MIRYVIQFVRRWRFCKKSPHVVKPNNITWKTEDSVSVNQFLCSNSGKKLLTAMDDVVFNAVMKGGNNQGVVDGMIDMKDYILMLGSPNANLINPRDEE